LTCRVREKLIAQAALGWSIAGENRSRIEGKRKECGGRLYGGEVPTPAIQGGAYEKVPRRCKHLEAFCRCAAHPWAGPSRPRGRGGVIAIQKGRGLPAKSS
jgi:hypothetical protein